LISEKVVKTIILAIIGANTLSQSKSMGTSILFVNAMNEVLLLLRDDIPNIRYPNMWDIPGGNVEPGETPEECIIREIYEEFGQDIIDFKLFEVRDFPDRIEFTYWQHIDFDINNITLTEGQRVEWFSETRLRQIQLAFDFNLTINSFFQKKPFQARD
jgi:8-oxo-dGTP diphosphatase